MRAHLTFAAFSLCMVGNALQAEPVKVTTFNIEFYGTESDVSSELADRRNRTIQQFLQLSGIDPDLFAFEEIVDVEALETGLLAKRYNCQSYEHSNRSHQHIVICHKKNFGFRIANDDDNWTWESVAQGTLRPAVHGILTKNGRDLAHVVALHLKAMPDQSPRRLSQTELIADHLANRGDELPVILLGDLNTYADDLQKMTRIFDDYGVNLDPIDMPYDYTYRTDRYRNKFDWMLVTDDVEVLQTAKVDGPCNASWRSGTNFDNLAYYNQNVSDHCPVSTVLDL